MDKTLRILQLNLNKQLGAQYSLMNDDALENYSLLLITEPHSTRNPLGQLLTPPDTPPEVGTNPPLDVK